VRFVQLVLTEEHAQLAAEALAREIETGEAQRADMEALGFSPQTEDEAAEEAQLERVQLLLADAAAHPEKYPPTGKSAATVRTVVRRAKGAAQPKPLNKRKQRQEKRTRTHKERRKYRRQIAESYNRSVAIYEAEAKEAEEYQAELAARVESQPKFRVVGADGQPVISGIPAEFIVNEETEENLLPKIILPGSA
jgi:hypothetical protein